MSVLARLKDPVLQALTLTQTLTFIRLLSLLKDDIILAQPYYIPTTEAPLVLPASITAFVAESTGIHIDAITGCWDILKEDIWASPTPEQTNQDDESLFEHHGWSRGITSLSLYPPSHECTNSMCNRVNPLKKAECRQAVVYTLDKGVRPAWSIHLYCEDCHTNYQYEFSVNQGVRTYYGGIPKYIQVGEHQFVERKLVGMWISLMLVAWASGTNCARSYDMSLSEGQVRDLTAAGWKFGTRLSTDHVWDAFIILSLLDYHDRKNTCLAVPHTGDQKDRFTAVMRARNLEVVEEGQDEIGHCCDKCMREWIDPERGWNVDTADDIETFHLDNTGRLRIHSEDNPGSVGITDEACEASKSPTGNRKYKALFGRSRTHNLQTIVRPCGVIVAQAPFYNAEAVSNVLYFVQKVFSVPRAHKPEHLIYDTNCDAKQQLLAHPDHWT
ncbi:hypothetical protein B0H13DRAFT_1941214, partial [Mycena leptocephala]